MVRTVVSVQLQRDLNGKVDLDVRSDHIRGSHLSQLGHDLNGESGSGDQCLVMHNVESRDPVTTAARSEWDSGSGDRCLVAKDVLFQSEMSLDLI